MKPLHVEYTSASLKKPDWKTRLDKARQFCDSRGWTFGVQFHNSAEESQLQKLQAQAVPLSFHAPTFNCDYIINLANPDFSVPQDSLVKSTSVIESCGGTLAVFHGFLMTDVPVLCFNAARGYDECMAQGRRQEFCRQGTNLCTNFLDTEEFELRFQRVKQRLAQINRQSEAVTWCIENDYPAYGSALLTAEYMIDLDAPLCLDLSHLWVACLLFENDFTEQVAAVAQTGNVKCVHLHANPLKAGASIAEFSDGHRHLSTPNQMNLPLVCRILHQHGVSHWVIETAQADLADLQTLADWLDK